MPMRRLIASFVLLVILLAASCVQYDGDVRPVEPDVDVAIRNSDQWYSRPGIYSRVDDPDGVYVLVPEMPTGNRFGAVRVSATSGEQRFAIIDLAPDAGTRSPVPAPPLRAVVRGLHFSRLMFHPFMFPAGTGPGFHHEDSATGRIDIVYDRDGRSRRLLTEVAFNSSRIIELLARVSVDRGGRWIAAPLRGRDLTWRLAVWRIN